MAELFLEYRRLIVTGEGRAYRAHACGAEARDGTDRWHGWLEFVPLDGVSPLCTARETTQPNRTCTQYWASGLTPTYLEGAFRRAHPVTSVQSTAGVDSFRTTKSRGTRDCSARTPSLNLTQGDRQFLKSLGIAP